MVPEGQTFHHGWQWQIKNDTSIAPFASDHKPVVAKLVMPNKADRGPRERKLSTDMLNERWFRIKVTGLYIQHYREMDTTRHGHGTTREIWKRRLVGMWADESAIRERQLKKDIEYWSQAYRAWLQREKNHHQDTDQTLTWGNDSEKN